MASRASLIQSRSIYVGTSNAVAPSDGNLIVTGNVGIGTTSPAFTSGDGLEIQRSSATATLRLDSGVFATELRAYTDGTFLGQLSNSYLDLGTDNSTKVRITGAGNVGIGTTAPGARLHVVSTGANAYSSTITKGSNMKGIVNTLSSNDDDMVGIYFATGGGTEGTHWSGITGSRSQNAVDWSTQLNFYTHDENTSNLNDATQKMVIKGNGNVGIGTTSPSFKLDVNGNTRIGGNSGSNTARLNVGGAANEWVADFQASTTTNQSYGLVVRAGTSSTDFPFYVLDSSSSTAFFAIKGNGNVGIGTTAPGHKLEVDGAANSIVASFDHTSFDGRQVGLPGRFMVGPLGSGYPEIGYNFTTSSSVYTKLVNDTAWGMTFGVNNRMSFRYAGAGTGTFSWSEFMSITNAGNVGIGTTNPTEKLDVAGSGKIQGNLFLTAADPYIEGSGSGAMRIKHTAGQVMYIRPDQTGNVVFFEGASGQTVYLNTATPSVNSTQNSSSALTFEARARNAGGTLNIKSTSLQNTVYDIASNLSRFSITGQNVLYLDGNVGVGTNTPLSRLHTKGEIRIEDATDTTTRDYVLKTETTGALSFSDSVSGERMRIDYNGNVGIGTNNPAQKLHVAGNGRFEGNVGIGHGSAAEYFLEIGQGRTGNGFAYIDLIGDATYTDYGLRIIRNNSGANTPSSINHRGLGTFSLNAEDAAPIAFLTSSSERMRITSDGNVGIGTTAPQQLIHVLGATNGYAMIQGASDSGQAGIYFKKEDTTGTMNRTKGLIVFHTNVGSGWGRGHLGFCLNSAESNTVVSVSDEKFRMVDNGDFLADGDVVAYSTTISDARYKTNIQPIESALDKVNQMRGVSFDWTAVRSGREFGVIAQEIEQIAPEVVSDKELLNGDTMKTVSYTSLVPFLIESIKELTQQVNELKAKLDGLTK